MVTFCAMSRCLLQYLSPRFERLSQTAQDLAPQPVSVQTMHKLSSIYYHHVVCNEAEGTASTKMGETVGMEQNQKDVCVEKMMDQKQALWSRHNACLLSEADAS